MQQPAAGHCRHCLHIPPPFFTEYFPDGLKLLLVGVDKTTLTKVQKYLPGPYYDISTVHEDIDALRHLQDLQKEGKNSYDLIFSEVRSEDKDSYPFIREVQRLCSNIAHVAISESETSSDEILIAYRSGACSVLWKPVSEVKDEIVNLWRHVCRMKEQYKASETHLSNNNNVTPETHLCDVEHMRREQHGTSETYLNNSHGVYHGDCIQQNRSVPLVLQNQDQGCSSLPAIKDELLNHGTNPPPRKRRVVWSGHLQKCFLDAVDELGGPDDATPKPILDKIWLKMRAPELTKENVGSHLQKLRDQKKKDGELHAQISLFEPYSHNDSLAHLPIQTQIQPSEQNFNNFGHGAPLSTVPSSLVGNGSNNLTSSIEELNLRPDSSRIPASGSYVTTTRVNPQVRNSFVSSMQRPRIGVHPHQNQNSSMYQLYRYFTTRGANNEGIQARGTFLATNTTGAQQLDRNQALGTSLETNMQELSNMMQTPTNQALGTSVETNMQELSNMMQTPTNQALGTSGLMDGIINPEATRH